MSKHKGSTSRSSKFWLMAAFGCGLLLIRWHLRNPDDRYEGLALEVGAGLFLFAGLYVYERRLVQKAVESVYRRIEADESIMDLGISHLTEQGDFYNAGGPWSTAATFVNAVKEDDFDTAWNLMDENLQECRGQSWLFGQKEILDAAGIDLGENPDDIEALSVEFDMPKIGETFAAAELKRLKEEFEGYTDGHGWASHRRIVGPAHEVVLAMPLPKDASNGLTLEGPTVVRGVFSILLSCRLIDGVCVYRVANTNREAAPLPGWPPTFWDRHDPLSIEKHPGMAVPPEASPN